MEIPKNKMLEIKKLKEEESRLTREILMYLEEKFNISLVVFYSTNKMRIETKYFSCNFYLNRSVDEALHNIKSRYYISFNIDKKELAEQRENIAGGVREILETMKDSYK